MSAGPLLRKDSSVLLQHVLGCHPLLGSDCRFSDVLLAHDLDHNRAIVHVIHQLPSGRIELEQVIMVEVRIRGQADLVSFIVGFV